MGHSLLRKIALAGLLLSPLAPAQGAPLTLVDLRGNPVPPGEVLAHPERLAAIFHLRPPDPREPSDFVPFREYILCNEAMVQWNSGPNHRCARAFAR